MKALFIFTPILILVCIPALTPLIGVVETEVYAEMPLVYVDPEKITANPGDSFTINVKFFNLTNNFYLADDLWYPGEPLPPLGGRFNYSLGNLFSFGIEFSWDPTILEYVTHTVHVPVEEHPDGALHEPIFFLLDDVDADAGTYRLAVTSVGPVEEFNCPSRNASVFAMTFNVKKVGTCTLGLDSVELAIPTVFEKFEDALAPIPHWVRNGEFRTEALTMRIQSLRAGAIVNETFNDPIIQGEDAQIEVTVTNEGELTDQYNLTLFLDGTPLTAWADGSLLSEENVTLRWSLSALDMERGLHTLTAKASILHGGELLSDELSQLFRVIDTPTLVISGPSFAWQGEHVIFSASGSSHNDPEGGVWNYTWSLFRSSETKPREVKDGENVTFLVDPSWSGGEWKVVLEVRDNFGVEYDEERPATAPYQEEAYFEVVESQQIHIKADGSVDPPDAPIISLDNITYTFTSDISTPTYRSISVERSNIVVDGNGHALRGYEDDTRLKYGFGFILCSNNVTIRNTIIKNFDTGVIPCQSGISDCVFSGNTITSNYYGISLRSVSPSHNNTIKGNAISNNDYGIDLVSSYCNTISGNVIVENVRIAMALWNCTDNFISKNNITNNEEYGLYIYRGRNNTFSGNRMSGNQYNFGIEGDTLNNFMHSIYASNTVDGKPIHYLINQTNLVIDPPTHLEVGYLAIINCVNITIRDLTLAKNMQGLLLAYTNYSTITGNSVLDNWFGVWMHCSLNNTVTGNSLIDNLIGLSLFGSFDNRIHHNAFISNMLYPVTSSVSENLWNDSYPSGGNYWSNYADTDLYGGSHQNETGSDGIGDTPYRVWGGIFDYYPLMKPAFWWNFADVNYDLKVNIYDAVSACVAFNSAPTDTHWNLHCDIVEPKGVVDMIDILVICISYGEEQIQP